MLAEGGRIDFVFLGPPPGGESLQNGLAIHFRVTPLFSMRTLLLLSLESCRSVELTLDVNGTLTVDLETVMLLSPH